MKFNYSIIQRMNIITKIYIEYNNENFVPSYRIAIFNDEISEIEGSKTNETFIKKRKNKTRSISQNIEELSNPPQKFEPKNHALITSDSISNRSTVPHFRVTEPFCDTFVSHPLSLSPPPPPRSVWTKSVEARGQIGSKLSLRTVIPGHVFWVGCTQDCDSSQRALSSRNTTAEETKIIPPPPSHSVASREMLYFLRFVFPLSRGSPSFGPPLFPREVVRLYFGRAWRFLDAAKEGSWRNESKVKQGKERGKIMINTQ